MFRIFFNLTLCTLYCVRTKLAHVGLRQISFLLLQTSWYYKFNLKKNTKINRVFLTVQSEIGVIAIDRVWQLRNASKENQVYLAELQKRHYSWRHLLGVSRKKKQILESF